MRSARKPLDEALKALGKTLVMTVGGAVRARFTAASSWRLARRCRAANGCRDDLADVFGSGVSAVSARGRSQAGEKTMLDVLLPVLEALKAEAALSI